MSVRNQQYPLYPYLPYQTFSECLIGMRERFPERVVLTCYSASGEKRETTAKQLYEQVLAFSAVMLSREIDGRRVAIAAASDERYIAVLFAICVLGGVAIPIDTEQPEDVMLSMLRRADAETVIFSPEHTALFAGKWPYCLCLWHADEPGAFYYDDILREGRALIASGARTFRDVKTAPDQPAMLVYTSGTTSIAKPVLLSQRNIITNACRANAMVDLGERTFTSLPLYHTYGLTCGVIGHMSHGKNVCVNGNLKTTMRDVKLFGPDSMTVVPLIAEAVHAMIMTALRKRGKLWAFERYLRGYHALARVGVHLKSPFAKAVREAMGGRLSMMVCGGAHIQERVAFELSALGIHVMQGYGITECSPLVSVNRNKHDKPRSAGLVLPDTEVRIEDGEIAVSGASVMLGYYGDEEATREVLRDGWFYTGDLGRLDKDGFLFIEGRKKNLIVFKNGKKVAPEEIEGYVAGIELIAEAVAYGAQAGDSKDDVKLALAVYPDPELTRGMPPVEVLRAVQERVETINHTLPVYKQIQIVTLRDKPFEKNSMKKIMRNRVAS